MGSAEWAGKAGCTPKAWSLAIYQSIGNATKSNHIYKVTFLTCRVGNSRDFIQKIAIDWNTLVKAYVRYVVFTIDPQTGRARAFLEGDAPGTGTNVPHGETEVLQTNFITVGPPLAAATTP